MLVKFVIFIIHLIKHWRTRESLKENYMKTRREEKQNRAHDIVFLFFSLVKYSIHYKFS